MKSSYILTLTIIMLSLLCPAIHGVEPLTYAQIVKQREEVLSQILKELEGRRASGHAVEEDIFTAQTALYSFRRDTATDSSEKLKHQQMIVAIHERRLAVIKSKYGMGGVANVDVLRATDGVLQAKQVLEDLRAKEKMASKAPGPTTTVVTRRAP